jgi:hypothetical protein
MDLIEIKGGKMFKSGRCVLALMLLSLLVLPLALACAPPAEEAVSPGASIVVVPSTIPLSVGGAARVKVYGSGFTPGDRVAIGMVGLVEGKDAWFDTATPSEFSSFTAKVNGSGLGALIRGRKVKPGVYTVIARSDAGITCTAPLVITEEAAGGPPGGGPPSGGPPS